MSTKEVIEVPIPKYNELYRPFLQSLSDGKIHTAKESNEYVAAALDLTAEELALRIPSGTQSLLGNRLTWTRWYLKKAGMVISPKHGLFALTEAGKSLLDSDQTITNTLLAELSPAFAEFFNGSSESAGKAVEEPHPDTPQEILEKAYLSINKNLADELLTEIMNQTPTFFEQLVVDLMCAMGYGHGFVTKASGDDGIDGIINEDKLGFNLIYIQAKRWKTELTVSKPEVQKFAGAMMGPPKIEKGLFITTARFSQGARDFANAQHIILVDGSMLTDLMIEHGIGVSVQKTYSLKRLDSDYFNDN